MAVVSCFNDAARPQTTLSVWPPRYFGDTGESSFSSLLMLDPLILRSFPVFSFSTLLRALPSSRAIYAEVTFSFNVKTACLINR